jgi:hypothetical protein
MPALLVYQSAIALLLISGLVPGLVFLSQHRPRQWKRLAAWDASGFVLIAVAIYLRSLILIVARWPGSPPHGWADAVFAIGSLIIIDALFILRLVSYRSFVEADRRNQEQPDL